MYENEVYENEVVETENEVVTSTESDYAPAPVTAPTEIIVPEATAESNGPNKALIAFAIGGGLLLANKARKKLKPVFEAKKAQKEQKKKQELMDMLTELGIVQKPAEPAKAEEPAVVDVPASDIKTEESTEETPETKDKGKKDKK